MTLLCRIMGKSLVLGARVGPRLRRHPAPRGTKGSIATPLLCISGVPDRCFQPSGIHHRCHSLPSSQLQAYFPPLGVWTEAQPDSNITE